MKVKQFNRVFTIVNSKISIFFKILNSKEIQIMKWSSELPTKEGIYWAKYKDRKDIAIVQIYFGHNGKMFFKILDHAYFSMEISKNPFSEWQGPITPDYY